MRILELDSEERAAEQQSELLIRVSWPFQVWKCSVPINLHPQINILEKLILSLADKKLENTKTGIKRLLCTEIGIDSTLVDKAIEECSLKKYFDQRYTTELKVSSEGKRLLETCSDDISDSESAEYSEERDFVYLFYSTTARAVIPRFDITQLPDEIRTDKDILAMPDNSNGSEKFPGALQLKNAIKAWIRIYQQQKSGEEPSGSEGTAEETHSGKANEKSSGIIIQMCDDHPEMINLQGYLLINRYRPEQLIAISPFGPSFDGLFEIWLDRIRQSDRQFNEQLSKIQKDKVERASQLVAFENKGDIQLFDDIPQICNSKTYIELKNRVIDMHDFLKKADKEQNRSFYSFGQNFRTAMDLILGYSFNCHPELEEMREKIKALPKAQQFERMNVLIRKSGVRMSFSNNVLRNVLSGGPSFRNTKDMIALMVIYAGDHPDSIIMNYLSANEQRLAELPSIINLIGNTSAHGNTIQQHESADKYYERMQRIIKSTFQYLIDGGV